MFGNFEYVRARSIDEACCLLTEGGDDVCVFAGGTDLLVDVRNGVRSPSLLVDVKRIDELGRLEPTAEGGISIGAAAPLNRIAEHAWTRERFPALAEGALSIATYQLRNRATIGGNLCNASPASDSIPPLLVVGAVLAVQDAEEARTVPLDGFCTGVKKTCLAPNEIVTAIRVPAIEPGTRTAFLKEQRIRGHDLAVVNLAGSLSPIDGTLRLAIGSCSPTPTLLEPIETAGHTAEAIADEAVRASAAAVSPISDVRASAEYRRAVLPVLVRRLVARLTHENGGA